MRMLKRVKDGYLFPNSPRLAKRAREFVAVDVPEGIKAAWVTAEGDFLDAKKAVVRRAKKVRSRMREASEVSDLEAGMTDEHGE